MISLNIAWIGLFSINEEWLDAEINNMPKIIVVIVLLLLPVFYVFRIIKVKQRDRHLFLRKISLILDFGIVFFYYFRIYTYDE